MLRNDWEGREGWEGWEGRELQDAGWFEAFGSPQPPNSEWSSAGGVGFGRIFRKVLFL